MKPPIIRMKLWKNTQTRPADQPLMGSPVFSVIGSMITKVTMKHVWHADAGRQRADVAAAGLLRKAIGEESVVEGGKAHHQPERGQDAAEHQ